LCLESAYHGNKHVKALWFSTENKALPEEYKKLRKAKNKKPATFLTDVNG